MSKETDLRTRVAIRSRGRRWKDEAVGLSQAGGEGQTATLDTPKLVQSQKALPVGRKDVIAAAGQPEAADGSDQAVDGSDQATDGAGGFCSTKRLTGRAGHRESRREKLDRLRREAQAEDKGSGARLESEVKDSSAGPHSEVKVSGSGLESRAKASGSGHQSAVVEEGAKDGVLAAHDAKIVSEVSFNTVKYDDYATSVDAGPQAGTPGSDQENSKGGASCAEGGEAGDEEVCGMFEALRFKDGSLATWSGSGDQAVGTPLAPCTQPVAASATSEAVSRPSSDRADAAGPSEPVGRSRSHHKPASMVQLQRWQQHLNDRVYRGLKRWWRRRKGQRPASPDIDMALEEEQGAETSTDYEVFMVGNQSKHPNSEQQ